MNKKLLTTALLICILSASLNAQIFWTKRYGTIGQDSAVGLVVSGDKLVVTGWKKISGIDNNVITICLNTNTGDTLWSKSFTGSAAQADMPIAITADANYAYVTGYYFNPTRDMFLIKYNITNGDSVWVKSYAGAGNGGDYGNAVYVDGGGNVYVTGRADIGGGAQRIVTMKYNAGGIQQWLAIYNPPVTGIFDNGRLIKVDASGNVYVAGYGRATADTYSWDYITIKYNSSGTQQWSRRYNGNADADDYIVGLALDNSNNVIVSGYSNRVQQTYDYVTIKYNGTTGDSMTAAIYGGTGGLDVVTAMTNTSDMFYVTGYSQGTSSNADYATIKYNSNLQQQWVARFSGPAGVNYPSDIKVNSGGFVYVTGASLSGGNYDYLTVRYADSGAELSTLRYPGPFGGNDYAVGLALDAQSNVYVTGSSIFDSPTPVGTEILTMKYTYTLSGLKKINGNVPLSYNLYQNYPNPFNPATSIKFDINKETNAKLIIYNILGAEVKTLVDARLTPGTYNYSFDASGLPSGIYMYKLITESYTDTKKMMLIK